MTAAAWKKLARENLHSAEALAGHETPAGQRMGTKHVNAAMSRLYYSLYQAVVGGLVAKALTPVKLQCPDPTKWAHSSVEKACRQHLGNPSLRTLYNMARSLRTKADYTPESPVTEDEFNNMLNDLRSELFKLGVAS